MLPERENKMVERLKLDKRGKVVTQPVTGFELSYLIGGGVLLSVNYVDNPRKLGTAEAGRVQLALSSKKARQLGESLQRVAKRSLEPPPSGTTHAQRGSATLWPLS
jgi:hypothetical protein